MRMAAQDPRDWRQSRCSKPIKPYDRDWRGEFGHPIPAVSARRTPVEDRPASQPRPPLHIDTRVANSGWAPLGSRATDPHFTSRDAGAEQSSARQPFVGSLSTVPPSSSRNGNSDTWRPEDDDATRNRDPEGRNLQATVPSRLVKRICSNAGPAGLDYSHQATAITALRGTLMEFAGQSGRYWQAVGSVSAPGVCENGLKYQRASQLVHMAGNIPTSSNTSSFPRGPILSHEQAASARSRGQALRPRQDEPEREDQDPTHGKASDRSGQFAQSRSPQTLQQRHPAGGRNVHGLQIPIKPPSRSTNHPRSGNIPQGGTAQVNFASPTRRGSSVNAIQHVSPATAPSHHRLRQRSGGPLQWDNAPSAARERTFWEENKVARTNVPNLNRHYNWTGCGRSLSVAQRPFLRDYRASWFRNAQHAFSEYGNGRSPDQRHHARRPSAPPALSHATTLANQLDERPLRVGAQSRHQRYHIPGPPPPPVTLISPPVARRPRNQPRRQGPTTSTSTGINYGTSPTYERHSTNMEPMSSGHNVALGAMSEHASDIPPEPDAEAPSLERLQTPPSRTNSLDVSQPGRNREPIGVTIRRCQAADAPVEGMRDGTMMPRRPLDLDTAPATGGHNRSSSVAQSIGSNGYTCVAGADVQAQRPRACSDDNDPSASTEPFPAYTERTGHAAIIGQASLSSDNVEGRPGNFGHNNSK